MAPVPAVSTIARAASLLSRNGTVTLNRSAVSKKASEVAIAGLGPVPPALFTRTSSRPKTSTASLISRSRSAACMTSVTTAWPRRRLDQPDDLVQIGPGPGRDDDIGACLRQSHGDAAADPEAAAGDDRDLAVEPESVEDHAGPPLPTPAAARPAMSGRSR